LFLIDEDSPEKYGIDEDYPEVIKRHKRITKNTRLGRTSIFTTRLEIL